MTVTIHPALRELLVDADQLKLHPSNPRVGDVDAIVESMIDSGVYRPVYAQRSTGYVLAGNHTFQAMRSLDFEQVPVVWLDVDDEAALRILLKDNLIADLGSYDNQQLADIIDGLRESDNGLSGLGITADLLAMLDAINDVDDALLADDEDEEHERREQVGKSFDVFSREHVIDAALDHYATHGYPYRRLSLHECMQEINALAALDQDRLRQTNLGYGVADTYHPHRLSAHAGTAPSPVDAIADPTKLRHGLNMICDQSSAITDAAVRTICNFVRATQACANFPPGFALSMYRRFAPIGARVLDTSTGYGGRLVGFLASQCGEYVGIDPNTATHEANTLLADDLAQRQRVELINAPAEDVSVDLVGTCDFAFTSPPYFAKERYSDEDTQSWKRYPSGEQWRVGFLEPMLALQFAALVSGARSVINIADVSINGKTYALADWTIDAARRAGFEYIATELFPLGPKRVPGRGVPREASEPLLIFRKP